MLKHLFIYSIFFLTFSHYSYAQEASKTYLFIGSYTEGEIDTGLYLYEFNPKSGALNEVNRIDSIINPSFLSLSSDGKFLYACTETKMQQNGSLSAFAINAKTGKLTFLNKASTKGKNPVHVSVHKSNKFVVVSNYTDAGIMLYSIQKDGSIHALEQEIHFEETGSNIIKKRQLKAHLHAAIFSPCGKFLFVPDLGTDNIRVFYFKAAKAKLEAFDLIKTSPGSGPRHFVFHPNKKYAYCIEELSGTVSSYAYKKGKLQLIDSDFSYSKQQASYGSSDIHISPDGKFLYASNRWYEENTISIFKINLKDGTLQLLKHQATFGDHPRSFVLSPDGKFLIVANQATGNIVVFKRDEQSGLLSKTSHEIFLNLPSSLKMKKYGH